MEIPNPQSQALPPQTNALPMGSPAAAGGNAIIQGFSNLAHGLLAYQQYQQQQAQAEQVAVAGNTEAQVSQALLREAQRLREEVAKNPNDVNPRDVNARYQAFADTTINDVLKSPELTQFPQLHKHLSTHLQKLAQPLVLGFESEQNKNWTGWMKYQWLKGIDGLVTAGAMAPNMAAKIANEDLLHKQLLGGTAIGIVDGKEADTIRENYPKRMDGQRAMNVITANPEEYLKAAKANTIPGFWTEQMVNPETFGVVEQQAHLNLAIQLADRNIKESDRVRTEAQRLQTDTHQATDRSLMGKFLDHAADQRRPALTFHDIADHVQRDMIDGPTARAMEGLLTQYTKGTAEKSDPKTLHDLFTRMALPWGDPKKITSTATLYEAATGKNGKPPLVSIPDVRQLLADFDKSRTVDGGKLLEQRQIFLNGQKPSIDKSNPLMGKQDQEGSMLYANFHQFVLDEEATAVRDNRNPHALYDPQSPDYLGLKTGPYIKSFQESIRSMADNLRRSREKPEASPPAVSTSTTRIAGETPEQYLKRIQK